METLLSLIKSDLRILHTDDDAYLTTLLNAARLYITAFGIILNDDDISDTLLIVDYAAWTYKKRDTDEGISKNLMFRFNTRLLNQKGTVADNAGA